jgi:hypothetical protein
MLLLPRKDQESVVSMRFAVGLYIDLVRQGRVTFRTLYMTHPTDYVCEPEGVLTDAEVQKVSIVLRRVPSVHEGLIGKYTWQEE